MGLPTHEISLTRTIFALPKRVYAAFTTGSGWCEWCAERAEADARVGGKLHIYTEGYNASGEYTSLDPDHSASFTWNGDNEPPTFIQVSLEEVKDGTILTFKVTGFCSEQDWIGFSPELERIWGRVLNHLKAVLEAKPEN